MELLKGLHGFVRFDTICQNGKRRVSSNAKEVAVSTNIAFEEQRARSGRNGQWSSKDGVIYARAFDEALSGTMILQPVVIGCPVFPLSRTDT